MLVDQLLGIVTYSFTFTIMYKETGNPTLPFHCSLFEDFHNLHLLQIEVAQRSFVIVLSDYVSCSFLRLPGSSAVCCLRIGAVLGCHGGSLPVCVAADSTAHQPGPAWQLTPADTRHEYLFKWTRASLESGPSFPGYTFP